MNTFQEYQSLATKVPASLRNNRDRILLPVSGLQQEVGKIGSLLTAATLSGTFTMTPDQRGELKDRLAEALWCLTLVSEEAGLSLQEVAEHSATQLRSRASQLDPDRR